MPLSFSEEKVFFIGESIVVEAPVVGRTERDDVVLVERSTTACWRDVGSMGSSNFSADSTRGSGDAVTSSYLPRFRVVDLAESFCVGLSFAVWCLTLLLASTVGLLSKWGEGAACPVLLVVSRAEVLLRRLSSTLIYGAKVFYLNRFNGLTFVDLSVVPSTEVAGEGHTSTVPDDTYGRLELFGEDFSVPPHLHVVVPAHSGGCVVSWS